MTPLSLMNAVSADRVTARSKCMRESGMDKQSAMILATIAEIVSEIDKELSFRDARLRKQASRIRALERKFGVTDE